MESMPSTSITVTYDGPALDGGIMDVRDLAPALMSLGKLFENANRVLYGDRSRIAVRVKAGFRTGSFEIDLSLAQTYISQMRDLLAGQSGTALANLLTILGFSGLTASTLVGVPVGLFALLKRLRGRKPSRAFVLEDGNVRLELSIDEWVVVPRETLELYRDLNVRADAYGALRPLEKTGIDKFSVRPTETPKDRPVEVVTKDDLPSFEPPEQKDETIVSQQHRAAFSIVNLSFSEDNKWRLFDGQNTVWAHIADQTFIDQVNRNEISFSKGDILICQVVSEQWQTSSGLRTETRIVRVEEHRSAAKQMGLPLEDEPPGPRP